VLGVLDADVAVNVVVAADGELVLVKLVERAEVCLTAGAGEPWANGRLRGVGQTREPVVHERSHARRPRLEAAVETVKLWCRCRQL
jgi:hypothetical protein